MSPVVDFDLDAFNGGVLSPRIGSRLRLPSYLAGSQILENLIPNMAGGLERRPGTGYVTGATGASGSNEGLFTSAGSWLIPFRIATGSSYVLEFSDYKLRFYRDGGLLLYSHAVFMPSQVNIIAEQLEIPGHGFQHGQRVTLRLLDGAVAPSGWTADTDYLVVLPEALRAKDASAAGLYEAEMDQNFDVTPQMGPYKVVHEAPDDSPSARQVWIHAENLDQNHCSLSFSKEGDFHDPALRGRIGNSLVPELSALADTFRLSDDLDPPTSLYRESRIAPVSQGTKGGYFEATDDPPVEIATPWTAEEVSRIQWTSDNDIMFFGAVDHHPPYELSRYGTSSFFMRRTEFEGGPLGSSAPLGGDTDVTLERAGTASVDPGMHPLITCEAGFFRGTDVGLAFRKTRSAGEGDADSNALKHVDMRIERLDNDFVSFWINEHRTMEADPTVDGVMIFQAGHQFVTETRVAVYANNKVGYVFPAELKSRQLYYLRNDLVAANEFQLYDDITGGDPIDFDEAGGLRIVQQELQCVDFDDITTPEDHGFKDGVEWAGLWIDGLAPQGLDVGYGYRVRIKIDGSGVEDPKRCYLEHMNGSDVICSSPGNGKFTISAVESPVPVARGNLIRTITGNATWYAANNDWRISRWGAYRGWPRAVTIRGERLMYGGTDSAPLTIFSSEIVALRSFVPDQQTGSEENPGDSQRTITEASSWAYRIEAEATERILWMHAASIVVVGTIGPIHTLSGLTPTTVKSKLMTSRGASGVRPIISDAEIIWGSSKHHHVFAAGFQEQRQDFVPDDLTKLADHIFTRNNHIIQMHVQEEPWSLLWFVLENGQLASCTYSKEEGVQAWAIHKLGGSKSRTVYNFKTRLSEIVTDDWAHVKSLSVIPSSDGRHHELWLVVERDDPTTASPTSYFRSVEVLHPRFELDDLKEDARFMDCMPATKDIIENATVYPDGVHDVLNSHVLDVWNDGVKGTPLTVSAGGVATFVEEAKYKIAIGIPYRWKWKSIACEATVQETPTLKGIPSEIRNATFFFVNTLGGKFGTPNGEMNTMEYGTDDDPIGEGPQLFTGGYDMRAFPGTVRKTNEILGEGTGPEPFFMTGVIGSIHGAADGQG